MRVPRWIIALATATFAFAIHATSAVADDIPALSPLEAEAVKSELLAWKASPAGQEARKRGILDVNVGVNEATENEIARFARGKKEVARLQAEQPSAVFSMDTPYALLSYDEYLHRSTPSFTTPLVTKEEPEPATATNTSTSAQRTLAPTKTNATLSHRALSDYAQVDWVAYGCVTPVEYRGACNAAWAFAAVGAIETNFCIKSPTKQLYRLSEQDAITCGPNPTCQQGIPPTAYSSIATYHGGSVCTEDSLPYDMRDGDIRSCSRVDEPNGWCDKPDLRVASFVQQQFPDHGQLEAIVQQRAVTAIVKPCGLNQWYQSGVLRGSPGCLAPTAWNTNVSHQTVLIVGFGWLNEVPYWKVKTSESTTWGMGGYAYIERGYQGELYGAFGIEMWISYPLFKSEMPASFDSVRLGGPRRGVVLEGTDLKSMALMENSATDCADICRREPGCKGYVFSGFDLKCTLKSSITGESFNSVAGFYSGKVLTVAEVQQSVCYPPEDNVDYPGEDMFHALAPKAEDCCDMCLQTDGCNAYSWSSYRGGMCYFKNRRAVKPLQLPPPANGGAPSVRSGIVYKCQGLQLNTDYPGNDLTNYPASAPLDCCALCRTNRGCAGYTWSDYNGGTCWLKRSMSVATYVLGVHAAAI